MSRHIVFIHGMWGGPWAFDNYTEFFQRAGFECHTPALPLHKPLNESDQSQQQQLARLGLNDYADHLQQYIEQLTNDSGEKPIILGHSMGGLLAQILCQRQLCERAVLVCPASPAGIHALRWSVIRTFFNVMTDWGFWNKPIRLNYADAAYGLLNKLPQHLWQQEYHKLSYESGRIAFEIGLWPIDPNKASRVNADTVSQDILVISGADDHITPASINTLVAKRYANAQQKIYPDHAHWLMAEPGWEAIAGDILSWLNGGL